MTCCFSNTTTRAGSRAAFSPPRHTYIYDISLPTAADTTPCSPNVRSQAFYFSYYLFFLRKIIIQRLRPVEHDNTQGVFAPRVLRGKTLAYEDQRKYPSYFVSCYLYTSLSMAHFLDVVTLLPHSFPVSTSAHVSFPRSHLYLLLSCLSHQNTSCFPVSTTPYTLHSASFSLSILCLHPAQRVFLLIHPLSPCPQGSLSMPQI